MNTLDSYLQTEIWRFYYQSTVMRDLIERTDFHRQILATRNINNGDYIKHHWMNPWFWILKTSLDRIYEIPTTTFKHFFLGDNDPREIEKMFEKLVAHNNLMVIAQLGHGFRYTAQFGSDLNLMGLSYYYTEIICPAERYHWIHFYNQMIKAEIDLKIRM